MWGGCEKSRTTSYQQFTNHNNIYILENIDNLNMGRPYDRYWSYEWNDYFDTPPEFWQNIYWSQDPSMKEQPIFPCKYRIFVQT